MPASARQQRGVVDWQRVEPAPAGWATSGWIDSANQPEPEMPASGKASRRTQAVVEGFETMKT